MVGGAARASKTALRYLLGTCVPSSKQNAAKVRISQLEFNNYIYMVSTCVIYIHINIIPYLDNLLIEVTYVLSTI